MKDSDKSFEDHFKDVFAEAELTPLPKVWQGVASQLGEDDTVRPLYIRWGKTAVAAMLLIGSLVYLAPKFTNPSTDTVKQNATPKENTPTLNTLPTEDSALGEQQSAKTLGPVTDNGLNPETVQSTEATKGPKVDVPSRRPARADDLPKEFNGQKGYRNGMDKKRAGQTGAKIAGAVPAPLVQGEPVLPNPQATDAQTASPLLLAKVRRLSVDLKNTFPLASLNPQKVTLAQPTVKEVPTHQWWIGAGATYNAYRPNFSSINSTVPSVYATSLRAGDASFGNTKLGELNQQLIAGSTVGFGLDFGRKLGKHWSVSTGLIYTVNQFQVSTVITQTISNNAVSRTNLIDNTLTSRTSYVSVPLRVWVGSSRPGLNYRASAGLLGNVLVQNSLTSQEQVFVSYDLGTYRPFHFSAMGSAGLGYTFSPKWGIYADVNYNRALQSVYSTDKLGATPHWIGLSFGALYHF